MCNNYEAQLVSEQAKSKENLEKANKFEISLKRVILLYLTNEISIKFISKIIKFRPKGTRRIRKRNKFTQGHISRMANDPRGSTLSNRIHNKPS